MGKTEKIVVLSVLFAVVVLFVWSLQGPEARAATRDEAPAPAPMEEAATIFQRVSPDDRRPTIDLEPPIEVDGSLGTTTTVADAAPGAGSATAGQGMLSAAIQTPEPPAPAAVQIQPGWDLVSARGLEPTVDPTMMVLQPSEGATWSSLAVDLYGDEARARLLRHYNEGMEAPGDLVFVPAVDDLGPEPTVRKVEVLDGESLWLVSERTLGTGTRWKEIFELNRGVISDASKVRPGMVLTIPAED